MVRFHPSLAVALLLPFVLPIAALAASQQVFYTDFDNPSGVPPEFSGVTTLDTVQGLAGHGPVGNQFSGKMLHNRSGNETGNQNPIPTRLTLTNLPQHTSVDLNFLVGILNTWDAGEDVLTVKVDGRAVFADTFSFTSTTHPVYAAPPGGLLTPPGGNPSRPLYPDLGFNNDWGDQAYNMGLEPRFHNIPHTADQLVVEFSTQRGFNGAENESFSLDNFGVVLNGVVPEPTFAGILGIGALLLVRKRR